MISVLVPTRGRVEIMKRMLDSLRATADQQVEVVAYVDDDDPARADYIGLPIDKVIVGPRIILTECWNRCFAEATGDILCQGNDDIIFRTPHWDSMVELAFAECPDKILLAHGSDEAMHKGNFGPHAFLHRRWIETVGYFIPPYFSSDFGDAWINEIANSLNRRQYLPFVVEHMHFMFHKAPIDKTTQERLDRHKRDNPSQIYANHAAERREQRAKLAAVMLAKGEWKVAPPAPLNREAQDERMQRIREQVQAQRKIPPCTFCGSTTTISSSNGYWCNQCNRNFGEK